MAEQFDITNYGAKADGKLCTDAIQQAIDACHAAGGGAVVCPSGRFITGSLELKSHVELRIESGCVLKASTDINDYAAFPAELMPPEMAPEGSNYSLIRAAEADHVAITGPGTIDGSGLSFYDTEKMRKHFFEKPETPRPRMVMFHSCTNVRLEDTSFVDSPCWTIWLVSCRRVNVHRICVRGDQRMINNDGLDIDGCRDVTVSDCNFETSDDCIILRAIDYGQDEPRICENITVTNCVLDSWCQGVRIGCPDDGIIRHAVFNNLVIRSENHGITCDHPMKYLREGSKGSADIHDIVFANVSIDAAGQPIRIRVQEGVTLRRLASLSFSNFRINSGGPCLVTGSTQTIIRDIAFSDLSVRTTGREAVLCRCCEGVRVTNVELTNHPAISIERVVS